VQNCEFFRIVDRFDHLAKPFGKRFKPDFQRLNDGLLLRGNKAFLTAFLTELLCKGPDFFATFLSELFGE
jgi:hypothetical protein